MEYYKFIFDCSLWSFILCDLQSKKIDNQTGNY